MNIMELGALGELVGGAAVIASLIYVGLQVRQNTQGVKEASNREITLQNDRILDVLLAELETRKTWAIATDNAAASNLSNPAHLDDVHWIKIQAIITFYLTTPMGRNFWHSTREVFWDAAFVEHIDQMEAAATDH
jgi:hypothetical protein